MYYADYFQDWIYCVHTAQSAGHVSQFYPQRIGLFDFQCQSSCNTQPVFLPHQCKFPSHKIRRSFLIETSQLLIITKVSQYFKERSIVSSSSNIWIFPWLVALVTLSPTANPWVRYALLTGLLSYPYCHAILVAWNSKNSNTVRTRAVSAALYNMFVQGGNVVATNIYRDDDKPLCEYFPDSGKY